LHFNEQNPDIKVLFSTLKFYDVAMSAHKEALPVFYGDLTAYTQDGKFFNSGLFTSRQNLKAYIRRGSQVLHAASKLY
jgi:hypothetical protein